MKSCFMFGHGDAPESIMPRIQAAIEAQYRDNGVTVFYVGNRGSFDRMASAAVKQVKRRFPEISLILVLAYHPGERSVDLGEGFDGSYYPPLESVPKRYAIVRANQHMIDTADSVICYVNHVGNTRKLLEYAMRKHRKEGVIIENVAETSEHSADIVALHGRTEDLL